MSTIADDEIRPDEAAPRPPRRRWLAPGLVVATIAVVVGGGYLVFAMLRAPVGSPAGFAGVVSVQPLSGWEVAGEGDIEGHRFIRLSRGAGTLDVVDWGPVGGASTLAASYRDALRQQLDRLQVSNELSSVTLADGTPAVEFGYVGVIPDTGGAVEGRATAAVTPDGMGVVFDGWGPEGMLAFMDGDIAAMVDVAVIG